MSDRPTPETDAEWDRLQMLPGGGYSSQVAGFKLAFGMAGLAAQLERQRDEARDQLTRICREGFGYQDTISLEPCANYALRKLKEERELARKLRDVLESAEAMLCKQETELRSLGADEPCAECAILDSRLALAKAKEVLP